VKILKSPYWINEEKLDAGTVKKTLNKWCTEESFLKVSSIQEKTCQPGEAEAKAHRK